MTSMHCGLCAICSTIWAVSFSECWGESRGRPPRHVPRSPSRACEARTAQAWRLPCRLQGGPWAWGPASSTSEWCPEASSRGDAKQPRGAADRARLPGG
jgi:hypothetical protein